MKKGYQAPEMHLEVFECTDAVATLSMNMFNGEGIEDYGASGE